MTESPPPFVSIVIPVRNGEATIAECLASVVAADYPSERREVLVVDNGSTDRTAQIIGDHPVSYLHEPRRGPSVARNRGIGAARGELVAFTDADCVVTSGWLKALVTGFDEGDAVWAVAGEIVSYPPATPAQRYTAMRKGRWQESALTSGRPFAITSNVAFRRQTFVRLGGFDPALLKGQDKDFGWRFFGEGDLKLTYRADALVLHRHRETAWGLFTQHFGWGYGAALLHRKYALPWSLRHELRKQRELAAAVGEAIRSVARHRGGRRDDMEVLYPAFELVRRAGLRAGALYGLARTAFRPPRPRKEVL